MSRAPYAVAVTLALALTAAAPVRAQAVISTRAGLVNFVDGAVTLDGKPLEMRLGKYQTVAEGSELRTAHGRAEVLLTPGVFLRIGENSAIRMVSGALADARVELLAGSAVVDSAELGRGTSVTLQFGNWSVRQQEAGGYRVDSQPARVVAREGAVEVSGAAGGPVRVEAGMEMPLAAVLVPQAGGHESADALEQWADGRAQSVAADDAIAEGIQDPGTMAAPDLGSLTAADMPDGFTYYPLLGLPAADPSLSAYGYPLALYGAAGPQLGFSSIYLPGYTYRPLLLGLPGLGMTSVGLRGAELRALRLRMGGAGVGYSSPVLPGQPERFGGQRYPGAGMSIGRPTGVRAPPTMRAPTMRAPEPRAVPHMAPRAGGHR